MFRIGRRFARSSQLGIAFRKRFVQYGRKVEIPSKRTDKQTRYQETDVGASYTLPHPQLSASPTKALADEPVRITVGGLQRHQNVTLSMRVTSDHDNVFQSHAYYVSDETGMVDLSRDPSLGGYYSGVEPMGLFWASKISPHSKRKYSRLGKKDVTTPQIVNISVHGSHMKEEDLGSHYPIDSLRIERWYMSDDVERIPLSDHGVQGVLFVPKSRGPFPGVIDLRGASGDVMEFRPAMLASHGFVTLALRYTGYSDLGKSLEPIKMEYFENAIGFLAEHDKVKGCGVGAVGISFGGTMTAAMAGLFRRLGCSVVINGLIFAMERGISYKGQIWEPLSWNEEAIKKVDNLWFADDAFVHPIGDDFDKRVMPFRYSRSPILFLISDDDHMVNQDLLVSEVKQFMHSAGNEKYEIVRYPGAGHLLEHPYTPLIGATYYSNERCIALSNGGETKEHSMAQEDSWKRIIRFLRQHLCQSG